MISMSLEGVYLIIMLLVLAFCAFIAINMHQKLQEQRNINYSRALFMHKLAHEIRNPLNGVLGFAEVLESGIYGQLNLLQKDRLRDIRNCGLEINNIVEDFNQLLTNDKGEIEIISTNFMVGELVKRALDGLESSIRSNDIKVRVNLVEPEKIVRGDFQKLLFVVKHIIGNAVKFSKIGGQIVIEDNCENVGKMEITVSDNGYGMSVDTISRAFDHPDTLMKSVSKNGVGFGLPISNMFLKLHGGSLDIDSEDGNGVSVVISIPLKKGE